jgi:hypothetical protein
VSPTVTPRDVGERPLLTLGQQFENAAAYGITEDVEGVHKDQVIGDNLYKSILI